MVRTSMSCFSSHGLAIWTCITRTLWFGVLQDDVLTVNDFTEAVIRNFQNKPAIYHTVPWLQASMNISRLCKYFIPWQGKIKKGLRRKVTEKYEEMGAGDIFDSSLVYSQSFPAISSSSYWAVLLIPSSMHSFHPKFLTLIRSRRREDLNIQSSLISSLLSRSSRLPLVQCSVTMPNMPVSKNRPRNRFRFSCRMSLS